MSRGPSTSAQWRAARDVRVLRGRARLGPLAVPADDRDLGAGGARGAAARPAAAAERRLQLPRLRAPRRAAPSEPVHPRDQQRAARPGVPAHQLAQPEESLRAAVHRPQLPARVDVAARCLLDAEDGHGPAEPRLPWRWCWRCATLLGPRPARGAAVRRRQPRVPDVRRRRLPQRLLHGGALDGGGRAAVGAPRPRCGVRP